MDKNNAGPEGRNSGRMREYVENMHKDISRSHKEREEQLSLAAQQYRESKRTLLHKYEELLIHYRSVCQQLSKVRNSHVEVYYIISMHHIFVRFKSGEL